MIWFYCKRSIKDALGHAILIIFPLILIFFFDYLYRSIDIETGMGASSQSRLSVLTIGFALTFQIYGSALSFETLAQDLYSPMGNRLFASPVEGRSLMLVILVSSTIVSFLQTLVVVLFSHLVLGAVFSRLFWVLLILLLSVVFNQLLGSIILLVTKGPKTANMVTTIYGSIAPMLAGLYFPLPQNATFRFIRLYGTPMNLANTASISVMDANLMQGLAPLLVLMFLTMLLFLILKPMAGRVRV
ncbi:MAG: hypothetical protein EOM15_10650 [Spirochaetia bacterium]|nr:hypothetical protein [Spirochaetia bacterium]